MLKFVVTRTKNECDEQKTGFLPHSSVELVWGFQNILLRQLWKGGEGGGSSNNLRRFSSFWFHFIKASAFNWIARPYIPMYTYTYIFYACLHAGKGISFTHRIIIQVHATAICILRLYEWTQCANEWISIFIAGFLMAKFGHITTCVRILMTLLISSACERSFR